MIQLQVLNKIIKDKDFSIVIYNNLDSSFFSDYTSEFNFIKSHFDLYGNVPDMETFINKFPEFDIVNVTESDKYLVQSLFDDKNKRDLAKTFNAVREALMGGDIERAKNIYFSSQEKLSVQNNIKAIDILSDTSRYDTYVDKCNDFSKYYIKTGFDELDNNIGGWDRHEELATISARPGVGKSWILCTIAVAAAKQGLNVGLYSGEMSETKVGYRIDTLISHISNGKLMHGNVSIQNDYKKYIDTMKESVKGSIKVLTPTMINGTAGVNALRAFIERENLDMLCIDQHSLLEDDKHAKNPVERASNISKDLKNLQVMKQIPIIAVSQQNRTSTENGLDVSHIAQSDRIAQDSTVVIFLDYKDSVLTLHLAKSRDGGILKDIKYIVDFDKGTFQYLPTENEPQDESACEQLRREFEDEQYQGESVF